MFQSILIPIDGSPCSNEALGEGAALAKQLGAKVVILHVSENPVILYGLGGAVAYQDTLLNDLREEAKQTLEHAKRAMRRLGVNARYKLVEGNQPAAVILEELEQHDLLVMGTHGRTGMKRWLQGSVTESVLRQAQKPCLIVHANA
jgi:nucleotide-binding universal stress UspA family protein